MRTVILAVHGLGANWLGGYGCEWIATPNLDRLAAEGTVYENHYAEDGPGFKADLIDPRSGGPPLMALRKNRSALNAGVTVIESDAFAKPWYVPQEILEDYLGEAGEAQARYAAALTYFDAEFGALREALPGVQWIVTGTCGTLFEDRASNEDLTHLPLIVGGAPARIARFTVPADVVPIAEGREPPIRTLVKSGNAVRTAEWTLIDGERLYRRPADRFEIDDVARLHPQVVEDLSRR
jgi:hypothetical protein